MARKKKDTVQFVCQSCGYVSIRWLGRCSECGTWNSFVEERVAPEPKGKRAHTQVASGSKPVPLNDITAQDDARIRFRSEELNRVLGGGLVPGSVVLVGGDPGIGKSTLLLQESSFLAGPKFPVLYVSGEESQRQTKIRAQRLGLRSDHLYLLAETNLDDILNVIQNLNPKLVIIDSIQTIYQPAFESAPGSISQVRECALAFLTLAKSAHVPVILVGHVTKEGFIAGPKVLEHMVDTLLQFEGDRNQFFRILRAVKNRFGSTREMGIFEMTETGLRDVQNPSELFLSQRQEHATGTAVICTVEGTRPILVEVQALVTSASYGTPQRTATGFDARRLALLLAVLEKRIGLRLGTFDVFLNVVGGVRVVEPAADLGVAAAIASSLKNLSIASNAILIGEIGLTGEIRYVPNLDKRLTEAAKLGFKQAVIPRTGKKQLSLPKTIDTLECARLEEAFERLF
ncbi:MAG: DNA repair protein RadA [candidate division KSB1 bacterium]|nr:DNA repair protein RadA [candidate division KSB1 bacterium]